MKRWVSLFTVLLLLAAPALFADKVEDNISKGLTEYKQGKTGDSILALSEAIRLMQNKKELKITRVELCSAIRGYGDFTPLTTGNMDPTKPIYLYIELDGFNVHKEKDKFVVWISEDLRVVNEKGKVLANKKDWMNEKKYSNVSVFPFFVQNVIQNVPPGKYTYEITIKDHLKKAFAEKTFSFTVTAPPPVKTGTQK